jgi:hypothetical protein
MKKLDSAGDPVVAFSPDGVAYYANIAFSRVARRRPSSCIPRWRQTWSAPNVVAFGRRHLLNDKN